MHPIRQAALIVIDTGTAWLLQKRENKDGIWWPGKIGCWGGAVEPEDASPIEGAYREIAEELNLSKKDIILTPVRTVTEPFVSIDGTVAPREYHYYVGKLLNDHFLHIYEGEAVVEIPYNFNLSSAMTSFSPNVVTVLEQLRELKAV